MMRKGDSEINALLESISVSRLEGEIWIYGAGNGARNEMPSIRMIDEIGGGVPDTWIYRCKPETER